MGAVCLTVKERMHPESPGLVTPGHRVARMWSSPQKNSAPLAETRAAVDSDTSHRGGLDNTQEARFP